MEPGLFEKLKSENRRQFYQLAPPSSAESSASPRLDDDTIREHNIDRFYRFELKFPIVNGAYGQVKQYATIRQGLGNGQDAEARDDRAWALEKITREIKEEVAQRASHARCLYCN